MALRFDWSECTDSEELQNDENWERTGAMAWLLMGIGMGRITEDNWHEVYARALVADYGDWVTPAVIHRYIGFKANVSTETRAKWIKRVFVSRLDDAVYRAREKEREWAAAEPSVSWTEALGVDG